MAIPVLSVGQVLTAAFCNGWFVPKVAYKSSDTSRASTTTPADDPDLTIALAANAVYFVNVDLFYACSSTGVDFKFQFTVPASSTGEYGHWYWSGASTFSGPANSADSWTTVRAANAQTGGDMYLSGAGTLFTSSTVASLTLQWSQNTSSGTSMVLRKGSRMLIQQVG